MFNVLIVTLTVTVLVENCQSLEDLEILHLRKCCPENHVFDIEKAQCTDFTGGDISEFEIDPGILQYDQYQTYEEDYEPSSSDDDLASSPSVNLSAIGLPGCDLTTSSLLPLVNKDNDPSYGRFIYDHQGHILIDTSDLKEYDDFCHDRALKDGTIQGTVAVVCRIPNSILCKQKPCISECCKPPTVYDPQSGMCRESYINSENTSFNPHLISRSTGQRISKDNELRPLFLHLQPECPDDKYLQENSTYDSLIIYDDGTLKLGDRELNYTQYCINNVEDIAENISYWPQIRACFATRQLEEFEFINFQLVPVLFIISVVFLVALAVFLVLEDAAAKLSESIKLCTILMLLLFDIILITIKFSGNGLVTKTPRLCVGLGISLQFCFLSAMCWLTSISFLMWSKFRVVKAPRFAVSRHHLAGFKHSHFKRYALFAWGLPSVVVAVTTIMQLLPPEMTKGLIVPGIGPRNDPSLEDVTRPSRCFLQDYMPNFLYNYLISGTVLLANAVMFCVFTYNLIFGTWARTDARIRGNQKALYKTALKMFLVLGVIWISEVVTWALQWAYGRTDNNANIASALFAFINASQGVIMFLAIMPKKCTSLIRKIPTMNKKETGKRDGKTDSGKSRISNPSTKMTSIGSSNSTRSKESKKEKEMLEMKDMSQSNDTSHSTDTASQSKD